MGSCATCYLKDQELRREVVALQAQGIEVGEADRKPTSCVEREGGLKDRLRVGDLSSMHMRELLRERSQRIYAFVSESA